MLQVKTDGIYFFAKGCVNYFLQKISCQGTSQTVLTSVRFVTTLNSLYFFHFSSSAFSLGVYEYELCMNLKRTILVHYVCSSTLIHLLPSLSALLSSHHDYNKHSSTTIPILASPSILLTKSHSHTPTHHSPNPPSRLTHPHSERTTQIPQNE